MTAPVVIQHPGTAAIAQQGLGQGFQMGAEQQKLGLERQQTEAGIAAKQKELELQERTVSANEAFRRGYGAYLENRGRYYGAKAEETTAQMQHTQDYINSLTDPEAKQAALLAIADPNLQRAVTAQRGQDFRQRALAGNYLLHAGPGTTWAQAEQIMGLTPKPGDEKIKGPESSFFDRKTQGRMSQLGANLARLSSTLHQAEAERESYRQFLASQQMLGGSRDAKGKPITYTPEQLDSLATDHISEKYGDLNKLHQQLIEGQAELTGILAPHLGNQQTPVIPDITGGGTTSGPEDNFNIQQIQQGLESLNDLYEQQNAANFNNSLSGAGGSF